MAFFPDAAHQPAGTTVSGYGGRPYLTSDAARMSCLRESGQTTDSITGITGRSPAEVYSKAEATGMSRSQLDALYSRLPKK